MSERPRPDEYAPFYAGYVSLAPEVEILPALERQSGELRSICAGLDEERAALRYAPGKWSVREVLGHLGDGERVFGFRAFAFSRGDENPLPTFDENQYVGRAPSERRTVADLVAEFQELRSSHVRMFRSLDPTAWLRTGVASGKTVSVRALAFIMVGHVRHHLRILVERYGVSDATASR